MTKKELNNLIEHLAGIALTTKDFLTQTELNVVIERLEKLKTNKTSLKKIKSENFKWEDVKKELTKQAKELESANFDLDFFWKKWKFQQDEKGNKND